VRGEFRFADGLVVPNNITSAGHQMILAAAFRGAATGFGVALGSAVFTPNMTLANVTELNQVNGYARIALAQNTTDWSEGALNGERFVESKDLVWAAVGGNFDKAFERMILLRTDGTTIVALSGALPTPRLITPTTPPEQRTLRYRVYLGV
jgi:hypothetical protein